VVASATATATRASARAQLASRVSRAYDVSDALWVGASCCCDIEAPQNTDVCSAASPLG
jgi:hypothetical protein